MGAPDVNEAEDVGRSMRRRLDELAETQHWVHHVGDLDSGEVLTTQLDRPVMPLSRAERLSRLGHVFDDTSIFSGPRYRLTPRAPYQAVPEASFSVSGGPSPPSSVSSAIRPPTTRSCGGRRGTPPAPFWASCAPPSVRARGSARC
jgi:hypothetical protein